MQRENGDRLTLPPINVGMMCVVERYATRDAAQILLRAYVPEILAAYGTGKQRLILPQLQLESCNGVAGPRLALSMKRGITLQPEVCNEA